MQLLIHFHTLIVKIPTYLYIRYTSQASYRLPSPLLLHLLLDGLIIDSETLDEGLIASLSYSHVGLDDLRSADYLGTSVLVSVVVHECSRDH